MVYDKIIHNGHSNKLHYKINNTFCLQKMKIYEIGKKYYIYLITTIYII